MVECSFTNKLVVRSSPVAGTSTSGIALVLSKDFFDIEANIAYGFTLKCVHDMIRTCNQMRCTDKYT